MSSYPKVWDKCVRCDQPFTEQDVPMLTRDELMVHSYTCVRPTKEQP